MSSGVKFKLGGLTYNYLSISFNIFQYLSIYRITMLRGFLSISAMSRLA